MKNKLFLLTVSAFLFAALGSVLADGMVIHPDPYSGGWDYSDESDQQAFINYQNGMEKMIVGVKIDNNENNDAVWVFPVPADPSKVAIDVVDELPEMRGVEIGSAARVNLSKAKDILFGSQIYPLFFSRPRYYDNAPMEDTMMLGAMKSNVAAGASAESDVTVYEHLDKEGMTSELITAKTADGIYDYFDKKGLKIEKDMIPALDAYIGKDYAFVVSWIDNGDGLIGGVSDIQGIKTDSYSDSTDQSLADDWSVNEPTPSSYRYNSGMMPPAGSNYSKTYTPYYQRNTVKGISVYFPTDSIYFPLLPTSVYGSKTVPATIKVVGLVDPRIYDGIKNFTKVSYYSTDYYSFVDVSGKKSDFFDKADSNYTKIEIAAPSKFLTEDLWMRDRAPFKALWTYAIAQGPWAVVAILLVLCSLVAVFIAGLPLFKGLRRKPWKLALLGLANCLTIIGMAVAVSRLDSGEPAGKDESVLIEKLRAKGYAKRRRNAKIFFTAAVFVFFGMVFGMEGLSYFFNYSFGYDFYIPYQISLLVGLAFLYSPLVLAFLGWRAAQVAPEDRPLFAELKTKGYSAWSLAPKSRNRGLFVVFFSLVFLVVAGIAIWLIEKTV